MKNVALVTLFAAVALASAPALADTQSYNFTSDPTGSLPSGWTDPGNAPTSAQVADDGTGNHVLQVYNNGNGNVGVIDNVKSPPLSVLAGETGPGAQPGAAASTFTSSFTFRTISDLPVAGFSFVSESYGEDRTTYLKFFNDGSGNLVADYIDTSDNTFGTAASFNDHFENTPLTWGVTYRVNTSIQFVNGSNNDLVTVTLSDAATNTQIWSLSGLTTWEQYYRNDPEQAGNGNIVTGADAIQFQMRSSTSGASNGVYVDDVTLTTAATPLPASAAMGLTVLGLAGLLTVVRRKRATL